MTCKNCVGANNSQISGGAANLQLLKHQPKHGRQIDMLDFGQQLITMQAEASINFLACIIRRATSNDTIEEQRMQKFAPKL